MAKAVIGAEVKIEGLDKAGQSVGSFKKQLKEAQQEVIALSDKFGGTSKEAANAAMKVASLKDKIGDAKALADTFNPDKKFVALGGAIQGVTAGFSAFSGAMGLLGTKSKETEELLLKVQSAMALQQGISGIFGAVDSFKLLGKAIQSSTLFQKIFTAGTVIAATVQKSFGVAVSSTSTGFKVLRGVIISTGIGALVVLIGVVISKIVDWIGSNESLEKSQARLKKSIEETTTATDKHRQGVSRATDEAIALAKSQGKNEAELYKIKQKGNLEDERLQGVKLRRLYDFYETQKGLFDKGKIEEEDYLSAKTKYTDAYDDYENFRSKQRIDQYNEEGRQREAAASAAEKESENRKAANEKRKQGLEKHLKSQDEAYVNYFQNKIAKEIEGEQISFENQQASSEADRQALSDNNKKLLKTKAEIAELNLLDDPNSIENKIAKINADSDLELFALADGDLKRQILTKQASDEITAIKEDAAARDLALMQNNQQQQLSIAGQAIGALADLVGRQTAAGKVMAIAEATINTFKAGLQVFAQPMPGIPPVSLGIKIASMVAAIAGGIVTVKKIVGTKVPGRGGGGSIPSMPSLSGAPLTPQVQTTKLDPFSINAVGNAANRSFVLETEISSNQERIRRLNRASRIN